MQKNNNLNYTLMRNNLKKNDKYSNKLSQFKNIATGLVTAASLAGPPAMAEHQSSSPQPRQEMQDPTSDHKNRVLKAIAEVESSGGKNIKHKTIKSGMHAGMASRSKYGLMPIVIKETIKKHPDLRQKYGHLADLKGDQFHQEYHRHQGLDDELASRHYDRLSKHFGHDINKISMAWLNGVVGAKRAINRGVNLKNHWHVQKVKKAYQDIGNEMASTDNP